MSSKIEDFVVLKMIGKGSFGQVFKVLRKFDQEIYAMKIINIKKMDKISIENTLNELRILSSLEH